MTFAIVTVCLHIYPYFAGFISYLFLYVLSMIIWLLLFARRQKIYVIVEILYNYRKRYNVGDHSSTLIQKILVILFLMIFILYQMLHHFEDDSKFSESEYWNLGLKTPKGNFKYAFSILIYLFFFYSKCTSCCVFPFILSVIWDKWSETLHLYKKSLQFHLRTAKRCKNLEIFGDFIKMTKINRGMSRL